MKFAKLLTVLAVGAMLSPTAMAKSSSATCRAKSAKRGSHIAAAKTKSRKTKVQGEAKIEVRKRGKKAISEERASL